MGEWVDFAGFLKSWLKKKPFFSLSTDSFFYFFFERKAQFFKELLN
jgi:hypothetical protein